MTPQRFDVAVIGAGPGGSTLATLLAQQNHSVALIEKQKFPTFKVGESLLPHSMDILKKSGVFSKLDSGKYIRKYGASFIDHQEAEPIYFEFANGLDSDHSYAFEVPRDEFDKDLLDHAQENGVTVLQPCSVESVDFNSDSVSLKTDQGDIQTQYLVDASGRSAFLGRHFQSREKNNHFINNVAVFNHYRGIPRTVQEQEGDIIIGILPDNSWSWHIPFQGEVTSVGVVCSPETLKTVKDQPDRVRALVECHPQFIEIMRNAEPLREEQSLANYSYSSQQKIGERWIMVGDAATFLDPVFSSGVHISLSSAALAADVLTDALAQNSTLTNTETGAAYDATLQKGVDRFQSLLLLFYKTAFYKHMSRTIKTDHLYKSFTSAISGDMWNEDNSLFRLGVLKDGKLPHDHYLK